MCLSKQWIWLVSLSLQWVRKIFCFPNKAFFLLLGKEWKCIALNKLNVIVRQCAVALLCFEKCLIECSVRARIVPFIINTPDLLSLQRNCRLFSFTINIIFSSWNAGDPSLPITLNLEVPPALSCSVLRETTLNFSGQLPFSTLPYKVDIPFHLGGFRYVLDPVVWWGARTTRRRQLCGESVCQRVRIKAICKEHTHTSNTVVQRVP